MIKVVEYMTRNAIVDAVVEKVIHKGDFGEVHYLPEYKDLYTKAYILTNYTDFEIDETLSDNDIYKAVMDNYIEVQSQLPQREIENIISLIDNKIEFYKNLYSTQTAYSMTDASLAYFVERLTEILEEFSGSDVNAIFEKINKIVADKDSMVAEVYKLISADKKKKK